MRDRLRFERRASGDDGYGNTATGFEVAFERAAEITLLRGGEEVQAARLGGTQPAMIRVRFDRETVGILSGWRAVDLRDPTRLFHVKTAADMERRRAVITMICEAGVAT